MLLLLRFKIQKRDLLTEIGRNWAWDKAVSSACHLKMRCDRKIDRLTQGRRSMVIDYYWTVLLAM